MGENCNKGCIAQKYLNTEKTTLFEHNYISKIVGVGFLMNTY